MALPRLYFLGRVPSVRFFSQLPDKAFVNGKWVPAASGKTFPVQNPVDESLLVEIPDMDSEDTKAAVDSSHRAFQKWKNTTAKERSDILLSWNTAILKNKTELATLLTKENGKPLQESVTEITYASSFLDWFAGEARRCYGDIIPSPRNDRQIFIFKQPVGVAAIITPWNFPAAMITRKIGAAFAAGCTCVVKPAEDTPLTALALAELAAEAGVPPGALNVVTASRSNTPAVGKVLCEEDNVRKLSFTGSTEVGRILYSQCAKNIKKISLELGGNAPFIVFESADLDLAVKGLMASKFRNTGQTCVCSNRIFVHSSVHDAFVAKLQQAMKQELRVGDGLQQENNQGPLVNRNQFDRFLKLVQSAKGEGAKVVHGGTPLPSVGPLFFAPTIITDVNPGMRCFVEEQFGPLVAICKFGTEEEVLQKANDCERGLAGYFYSRDVSQIWRVALNLEVGMVGANEAVLSACENAFGGIKQSGIGSEGSKYGIDEYIQLKSFTFGGLHLV
ncbi:unnamed protein product [Notodromas monacha]|uniref:Succinate-semialdehyde dehydrogenase, mitochondrial n=1 Tax=Notodromas monacha TaxID=399045 RepID=A0A7R9BJX1_9CRUS|nr:unnamed protein product [Notodromas monacha]CAG0915743.1 unnamed protein product [Notodromas monacha]